MDVMKFLETRFFAAGRIRFVFIEGQNLSDLRCSDILRELATVGDLPLPDRPSLKRPREDASTSPPPQSGSEPSSSSGNSRASGTPAIGYQQPRRQPLDHNSSRAPSSMGLPTGGLTMLHSLDGSLRHQPDYRNSPSPPPFGLTLGGADNTDGVATGTDTIALDGSWDMTGMLMWPSTLESVSLLKDVVAN